MESDVVLVVSPYRREYGPRRTLDHVVRAIELAGCTPKVAVHPEAELPERLVDRGIDVHTVEALATVPRTLDPIRLSSFVRNHLGAAAELERLGSDTGARAVYSISEAIVCGSLAARRLGIPAFVHAIGMSIQSPRLGALAYVGLLDRVTEHFIACSSAVAEMFVRLGVADAKVTVVHNGVSVREVEQGAAFPPDLEHSGPRIGMIAAYDPRKGHELFLEAAALVASELPEARFYLIGGTLAGSGESATFAERIDALIRALRLDQVERVGFVPAPEVYGWIRAMDVIVVPSRTEAFANALLEAMACVRPVIATGIEGNLDAFVHGHSGIYTPPDSDHLARAIVELVSNPQLAASLGRAARARVEALFDLDVTVQANAAVVSQALADGNAPSAASA